MMKASDREELRGLPGNDRCADCPRRNPDWASVSLGLFVCLECSGRHRGLGTHISFVRSVRMDSWSEPQLAMMRASGGNDACRDFLRTAGVEGIDTISATIREKYDSPAGELWRRVLRARVAGTEEPTELPEDPNIVSDSDDEDDESDSDSDDDGNSNKGSRRSRHRRGGNVGAPAVKIMEGFGSSPHPSTLPPKNRRGRRILGAAAAGIGAVAGAVRRRRRRQQQRHKEEPRMVSATLSTRV